MNTDPISDLLTRIRNAQNANQTQIIAPYSRLKEDILKVMKKNKFIEDYSVNPEGHKSLQITIPENSQLTLKRISSPGQRIYVKSSELKPIKNGLGIRIISTSKGLMNNTTARRQKLGGEVLCEIY